MNKSKKVLTQFFSEKSINELILLPKKEYPLKSKLSFPIVVTYKEIFSFDPYFKNVVRESFIESNDLSEIVGGLDYFYKHILSAYKENEFKEINFVSN